MREIADKQEVVSIKIDDINYDLSKDLALSTLGFFIINASGNFSKEIDQFNKRNALRTGRYSKESQEQIDKFKLELQQLGNIVISSFS